MSEKQNYEAFSSPYDVAAFIIGKFASNIVDSRMDGTDGLDQFRCLEIFDQEIRRLVCPNFLTTQKFVPF